MTPFVLAIQLQDSLPPPPEPTGSPEIDTVRVIGVVLVSLAIIVLLALAIRPFIVKPVKRRAAATHDQAPPDDLPDLDKPPVNGSIIPFPRPAGGDTSEVGPHWSTTSSSISERLNRVIADPNRRRKLGDRQPTQLARELSAAMHRTSADTSSPLSASRTDSVVLPPRGYFDQRRPLYPGTTGSNLAFEPMGHSVEELEPQDAPTVAGVEDALDLDASLSSVTVEPEMNDQSNLDLLDEPLHEHLPEVVLTDEVATLEETTEADVIGLIDVDGEEEPVSAVEVAKTAPGIEEPTLAALHQLVRDLIYSANSGELLKGFSLYSDPFIFRFMDESGMSEDEFRDFFSSIPARPDEAWDHLDELSDIVSLPDGRIEATATYVDGSGQPSNGVERYRFVQVDGVWMIDDIASIE